MNDGTKKDLRTRYRGLLANSDGGAVWIAALVLAVLVSACSAHHVSAPVSAPAAQTGESAANSSSSTPEAKVHINYATGGDYLSALTVTKYPAAYAVDAGTGGGESNAPIFRFDGGVPVWQIEVDKSMLSGLPGLSIKKEYRLDEVRYGALPKHFEQAIPDSGPPEPLEPSHYYIFSVTRASGSTNFEAIKVEADGSLEGYEAEPRAGTSFRVCCNVSSDFATTAPSSASGSGDSGGP